MMKPALLMCRVSSPDQVDGGSLSSQEKFAERYMLKNSLQAVKRWVLDETASKPDERKKFNELINYGKKHPEIKALLFEKPDRLLRNVFDLAKSHEMIYTYDKEIHFFKTEEVIHKKSPHHTLSHFNQDCINAINFINTLKHETEKGVLEKIEAGWFPGLAPAGYENDTAAHTIVRFEEEARWVKRAFELMRSGAYTLDAGVEKLRAEGCPRKLLPHRSTLEKWIRNEFYYGDFEWRETLYPGAHTSLVSKPTWDEANAALSAGGKTIVKRGHPYTKLIHCADPACGCMITAEGHKGGRLVYYRCAWSKGKCTNTDYVPQARIEEELGRLLRVVQVDSEFADWTLEALSFDAADSATRKVSELAVLRQQLQKIVGREDGAYNDKLDGVITEEDWRQKKSKWANERRVLEDRITHLEVSAPSAYLSTARRILELSKCLPDLFFSVKPENRRQVFRMVSLNTTMMGKTLTTTYQTPWSFLAEKPQKENWGDRGDLNPRPPRSQRGALTS